VLDDIVSIAKLISRLIEPPTQPLDLYGSARVLSDSRKNDERGNTGGGEKASEKGRERERTEKSCQVKTIRAADKPGETPTWWEKVLARHGTRI